MAEEKKAKKISWQEAVNDFYQLKRIYEEDKQKLILKIVTHPTKTKEQKKKAIQDIKLRCVDCGKPVGTKFSTTYDQKKDGRMLTAVCGDMASPCGLNIKIFCGNTETYGSLIQMLEKEIESLKNKIIDEKNKLLFGFISNETAVETFDDYKKDLAELTERLASLLELYTSETDNRETKEAIYKVQEEICKDIYLIKDSMKKFDRENNLQHVKDAVEIYKYKIVSKLNQLAHLEYTSQDVAYDEETNSHVLIRRKTNMSSLELTLQDNKVIAFEFKKVNKSTPIEVQEVLLKKEDVLSIADTLLREKLQKKQEEEKENDNNNLFSLNDNGEIVWAQAEYETLWRDDLTKLIKQTLIQDPVWMESAMRSFVQMKREGKNMDITLPPNLLLPPKQLGDGTFDLGNDFFNEIYAANKDELSKLQDEDETEFKAKLLQLASQKLNI
jgi:hypothetical protein